MNFTYPLYHTVGTITDTSVTLLLFKRSFKSWEGSSVATQFSKEQGLIYYCFIQMGYVQRQPWMKQKLLKSQVVV